MSGDFLTLFDSYKNQWDLLEWDVFKGIIYQSFLTTLTAKKLNFRRSNYIHQSCLCCATTVWLIILLFCSLLPFASLSRSKYDIFGTTFWPMHLQNLLIVTSNLDSHSKFYFLSFFLLICFSDHIQLYTCLQLHPVIIFPQKGCWFDIFRLIALNDHLSTSIFICHYDFDNILFYSWYAAMVLEQSWLYLHMILVTTSLP